MSPLAHANQSVLIQRVPQTQKKLFRPQANTKNPQENTRLSFAAKTAMTVLSSLSASYLLYQNLSSKISPPPPPSLTTNPMFWVMGSLTASALLFFSKMNKCLIKKNDEEISGVEHQKSSKETYKTIKNILNKTNEITDNDFEEFNKIIEHLETDHQSALACKEINDEILNSNNNELKLKLAILYAKNIKPRPFRQIIRTAWDAFHKVPNLATEFLITCTHLKDKVCQSYLIIFGNLNFGQENNTHIALACAADMTLQGNKLCAFNACEKHLKEKQYDLFLPIAKKIIESSKKAKNTDDTLSFYQDIIKSFFNTEKGDDKTNMHRLIKILTSISIISKDEKTTELILKNFNLNDFDLSELYKQNQDPQEDELNDDHETQENIKKISL